MSDERLAALEEQVGNLRVSNAELAASVEHLTKAVDALTLTVQALRDIMNRGRGALWVVAGAAASLGALLTDFLKRALGIH